MYHCMSCRNRIELAREPLFKVFAYPFRHDRGSALGTLKQSGSARHVGTLCEDCLGRATDAIRGGELVREEAGVSR